VNGEGEHQIHDACAMAGQLYRRIFFSGGVVEESLTMTEKMSKGTRGPVRRGLARQFRQQPTPAEKAFWELVRDHRFDGYQFRRQHPLGSYIADFYRPKLRLAVELDGGIHKMQIESDRDRDNNLAVYGIHVVRIKNEELLTDPQGALNKIRLMINLSIKSTNRGKESHT
jgi:very-short-patch-repair endonuclease